MPIPEFNFDPRLEVSLVITEPAPEQPDAPPCDMTPFIEALRPHPELYDRLVEVMRAYYFPEN